MRPRNLLGAAILAVVTYLGLTSSPVLAHGFGVRYELPLPLNYFLIGASASVAFSFVVIGWFTRKHPISSTYPRFNVIKSGRIRHVLTQKYLDKRLRWIVALTYSLMIISVVSLDIYYRYYRDSASSELLSQFLTVLIFFIPAIAAVVVTGKILTTPLKALSVELFVIVMATAYLGTDKPINNFAPTFVWVIWWVGMAYSVALIGNLWALVNPLKIIYEWVSVVVSNETYLTSFRKRTYPIEWGIYPAIILFILFGWVENVYSDSSTPINLGFLILSYSIITWMGMAIFGKNQWLARGEIFTVLFGFLSRFSPTEARVTTKTLCKTCSLDCDSEQSDCIDCYECLELAIDLGNGEINIRPYSVGLTNPGTMTTAGSIFIIIALSMVTFDGLKATQFWSDLVIGIYDNTTFIFGSAALTMINTLGLLVLPIVFFTVYLFVVVVIRMFAFETKSPLDVATTFVLSLIPIAIAYNLAHFISNLAIQGQNIIRLASDPFGIGWDLLGTQNYQINIYLISSQFVWFVSVVAIVVGHIVAVYVAHVIALRLTSTNSLAIKSQYPMLVLMVFYTATSLWIIAQPIVA